MKIVVHLGAHKTASTYLQKCLALSRKQLQAAGVLVQAPRQIRPHIARWPRGQHRNDTTHIADALSWLIDRAEENGTKRLILSEEQFLGTLNPMINGGLMYGHVENRFSPLVKALQGRPFEVAISVRNYAEFFASAYCQIVRGSGFRRFGWGMRTHMLDHPRGWPEITADIAGLCPRGTPIRIWRYEDFERLEQDVFAALTGPFSGEIKRIGGRPLARPAHRAIELLHEQANRGIMPSKADIRAIYSAHPVGPAMPRFNPWTAEERRFFDARYRQDLIALTAEPSCQWLLPAEEAAA